MEQEKKEKKMETFIVARQAIIKSHAERIQSLTSKLSDDNSSFLEEIAKETKMTSDAAKEIISFKLSRAKYSSGFQEVMGLYELISSTPFVLATTGSIQHENISWETDPNGILQIVITDKYKQNRIVFIPASGEMLRLMVTGFFKDGAPVFQKIETDDGTNIPVSADQTVVLLKDAAFRRLVESCTKVLLDGSYQFERVYLNFNVFKTI